MIKGDRVNHKFLANGTVERFVKPLGIDVFAYIVKFDTDPPVEYNGGANPCMVYKADLIQIDNE